jgi:predicted ATPase
MERAGAGAGRLLLFTGEPGIGKSRLAEQVALEAAGRGATVAFGRCWEAGEAPAYWPWIDGYLAAAVKTGTTCVYQPL